MRMELFRAPNNMKRCTGSRVAMWLVAVALPCCGPDRAADRQASQAHLQQGRIYVKQNLPDSALAAFGLALEHDPKLVEAHVGMADIYYPAFPR